MCDEFLGGFSGAFYGALFLKLLLASITIHAKFHAIPEAGGAGACLRQAKNAVWAMPGKSFLSAKFLATA